MPLDTSKLSLVQKADGIELTIKVVPGASRDRIAGAWGTGLRVAVAAPPEGGKANAAVERLLATALGVPSTKVRIIRGLTNPIKTLLIHGLSAVELGSRLAAAAS